MPKPNFLSPSPNIRKLPVTERNLWFLERSIPLYDILDFFPPDALGPPNFGKKLASNRRGTPLTIETDLGWSFTTDIASDQKIFRNSSRQRGTGRWVKEAQLKPGDYIVIEKLSPYHYRLSKESNNKAKLDE
ncbi:MAG: hypothetical protein ACK4OO_04995 [bacterium]